MNKPPSESWEKQVADVAQRFSYPPTPNIADRMREREQKHVKRRVWRPQRLVMVACVLLCLLIGVMSVPTGRASLIEFLQFGAIRIWFVEPEPTVRAEVAITEALFVLDDDMKGEMTLAQAEEHTNFSLRLPTYPETLGKPDRIFTLNPTQKAVLLVWLVPGSTNQVGLSLHQLNMEFYSKKTTAKFEYVQVNGTSAAWLSEPHDLYLNPMGDKPRRVEGNVLIWVEKEITYRLETNWSLEEAVRFAESLVKEDN